MLQLILQGLVYVIKRGLKVSTFALLLGNSMPNLPLIRVKKVSVIDSEADYCLIELSFKSFARVSDFLTSDTERVKLSQHFQDVPLSHKEG